MDSYYKILPKGKADLTIDILVKIGSTYNPQLKNETINFNGVTGSKTVHQGTGGGQLKITPVFELNKHEDIHAVELLKSWWEKGTEIVIIYASGEKHADLLMGGNYKITDVNIKEFYKAYYEMDLTLQKQVIFPVTYKTFTNWKAPAKKTSTKTTTKTLKNSLYQYIIKNCKIPLYINHAGKNNSTKCDLAFQKLLRLFGFYFKDGTASLKLDGYYGLYTKRACIRFQKKYKVKVTGRCDVATLKKIKELILKGK
jgi:hypothetical protein